MSNGIAPQWLAQHFPDLQNIQPLATGGQKEVFSATHPTDGDVVLKIMDPSQDIERTLRELIAVTQVNSARVPAILGQGTVPSPVGDRFWFREKRIAGDTVRAHLASGPFDHTRLLRMGMHVLETLVASENVDIVHRDVKPDNLILDPSDEFWLIDFGLARHLGLDSLTATANAFGHVTWGYAPPEQCRNIKQDIDARADLFALGVTLYECAIGVNPFRDGARDVFEVLNRVETQPLPRLRLNFGAAADFADLVEALTQKRRDHRPATARAALDWMNDIWNKENP